MLFACMQRLRVWPVSRVVKVGDTISDISEGKSAGAWAIGILTGSNLVGLDQDEAATLPAELDDAAVAEIYGAEGAPKEHTEEAHEDETAFATRCAG